jgi:hypothetical protein
MIRLDKEICILLASFFSLCIVATIMTVNSNSIISGIKASRTYQTPSEELFSDIQKINGCYYENKTQVPSTINAGKDYLILTRCIE